MSRLPLRCRSCGNRQPLYAGNHRLRAAADRTRGKSRAASDEAVVMTRR
jgi:hypothetical protein